MKALGALILSFALVGCATTSTSTATLPAPACPAGQEARRTAQLFFGRNVGEKSGVSEADFRRFVDEELTPRFPDGLTVLDGGGQWRGEENRLIREASKVVLIVLPKGRDGSGRVEAVRNAYKTRFHQEIRAADHPGGLRLVLEAVGTSVAASPTLWRPKPLKHLALLLDGGGLGGGVAAELTQGIKGRRRPWPSPHRPATPPSRPSSIEEEGDAKTGLPSSVPNSL